MTDELTALLDHVEDLFGKFHVEPYKPPQKPTIVVPKPGAKTANEALERVRYLAGKHNSPDYLAPMCRAPVSRQLGIAERHNWRANQYTLWVLSGKRKPDMRCLYHDGKCYHFRAPGSLVHEGLGGVHEYHKALKERDRVAAERGIDLANL